MLDDKAVVEYFRLHHKEYFADEIHKLVHQSVSSLSACGDFL